MKSPSRLQIIWSILLFILVLSLIAPINLIIHEFGHCVTIDSVGGGCEGVYVLPDPGYQIWPLGEIGEHYRYEWRNYFGLTSYEKSPPTEWARGLVSLMGSGTVAIVSSLALIGLYGFRPKNWLPRFALLAQSIMFLDILFYTTLPRWFGLRHFFFIGGDSAEPLDGAVQMGIAEPVFMTIVLVYSATMIVGIANYVRKNMKYT